MIYKKKFREKLPKQRERERERERERDDCYSAWYFSTFIHQEASCILATVSGVYHTIPDKTITHQPASTASTIRKIGTAESERDKNFQKLPPIPPHSLG